MLHKESLMFLMLYHAHDISRPCGPETLHKYIFIIPVSQLINYGKIIWEFFFIQTNRYACHSD